jgi:hypothetical protein
MPLAILAYHSHHVVGPGYRENDHVAFARDLDGLTDAGWRIVPLADLVRAHREGASDRLVALTFDDGPVYDVEDVVHPDYGLQRGFANAMRAFAARRPGAQPSLHATSFVIASPEARFAMERARSALHVARARIDGRGGRRRSTRARRDRQPQLGPPAPGAAAVRHSRDARGDSRRSEASRTPTRRSATRRPTSPARRVAGRRRTSPIRTATTTRFSRATTFRRWATRSARPRSPASRVWSRRAIRTS